MALQKPGVMLYFEMRNVFEELSNEKRGILVSAILDYYASPSLCRMACTPF